MIPGGPRALRAEAIAKPVPVPLGPFCCAGLGWGRRGGMGTRGSAGEGGRAVRGDSEWTKGVRGALGAKRRGG